MSYLSPHSHFTDQTFTTARGSEDDAVELVPVSDSEVSRTPGRSASFNTGSESSEHPASAVHGAPSFQGSRRRASFQSLDEPRVAFIEEPARPLQWTDVASLIINKMVGTGIFTSPPVVFGLAGSKPEALALWIAGLVYTLVRSVSQTLEVYMR